MPGMTKGSGGGESPPFPPVIRALGKIRKPEEGPHLMFQ